MAGMFKKTGRIIAITVMILFGFNGLFVPAGYAQVAFLPAPGAMVNLTGKFDPMVIKGIELYPDNPFKFDFIVDTGEAALSDEEMKEQGQKLISYFLASLTTPEKEMWVNLSPYEKDRIIPAAFGGTEMGKELLSQDYLLKQIMATALYPERDLGKQFWQKVYSEARAKFGTSDVPVSTFNKVWILPDKAVVYENTRMNSVFVVESSLKVMLEQDYLASNKNKFPTAKAGGNEVSALSSKVIKEIVIPALEKEVNEGKNFAPLRQVYQSLILAAWYKKNLKDNIIVQAYVDRNKTKGVDVQDKDIAQKIYQQYLQAYRKGVYNFIKEDIDPATRNVIPRKYFSGGVTFAMDQAMVVMKDDVAAAQRVQADLAVLAPRLKVIAAGADLFGEVPSTDVDYAMAAAARQVAPVLEHLMGLEDKITLTDADRERLEGMDVEALQAEYTRNRTAELTEAYGLLQQVAGAKADGLFVQYMAYQRLYHEEAGRLILDNGAELPANPFADRFAAVARLLSAEGSGHIADQIIAHIKGLGLGEDIVQQLDSAQKLQQVLPRVLMPVDLTGLLFVDGDIQAGQEAIEAELEQRQGMLDLAAEIHGNLKAKLEQAASSGIREEFAGARAGEENAFQEWQQQKTEYDELAAQAEQLQLQGREDTRRKFRQFAALIAAQTTAPIQAETDVMAGVEKALDPSAQAVAAAVTAPVPETTVELPPALSEEEAQRVQDLSVTINDLRNVIVDIKRPLQAFRTTDTGVAAFWDSLSRTDKGLKQIDDVFRDLLDFYQAPDSVSAETIIHAQAAFNALKKKNSLDDLERIMDSSAAQLRNFRDQVNGEVDVTQLFAPYRPAPAPEEGKVIEWKIKKPAPVPVGTSTYNKRFGRITALAASVLLTVAITPVAVKFWPNKTMDVASARAVVQKIETVAPKFPDRVVTVERPWLQNLDVAAETLAVEDAGQVIVPLKVLPLPRPALEKKLVIRPMTRVNAKFAPVIRAKVNGPQQVTVVPIGGGTKYEAAKRYFPSLSKGQIDQMERKRLIQFTSSDRAMLTAGDVKAMVGTAIATPLAGLAFHYAGINLFPVLYGKIVFGVVLAVATLGPAGNKERRLDEAVASPSQEQRSRRGDNLFPGNIGRLSPWDPNYFLSLPPGTTFGPGYQLRGPIIEESATPPIKNPPLPRKRPKRADVGGIDLEKVEVNARRDGSGVKTAFSDPAQLNRLMNADGLVPVIYNIQPVTVPMMNMLLGLNTSSTTPA